MIDGRSSYSKVLQIHDILTHDYTINDVFTYDVIEYLITATFGYGDKRTYEKFFTLLETGHLITKHPNAHKISKRKTVTKQKSNGGDISFQFFRGDSYCWSHYQLGQMPLRPCSPQPPLQSRLNEREWNEDGESSENICVRVETEGLDGTASLDANIRDATGLVASDLDAGERKVGQREKRESSIPHTHILSKKLEGEDRSHIRAHLHLLRDGAQTR